MKKILYFLTAIIFIFMGEAYASDGFTQKDRELLIELKVKMTEIDKWFEQVDKRFEQVDKRFEQVDKRFEQVDKRFEQVDKRINEVRDGQIGLERRIGNLENRIDNLMYAVLSGFIAIFVSIIGLISVVLWDRRTTMAPAVKKNKELEEREERIEKALKEYAYKEPRFAEILRSVGII
jgi:chaperonin cofactor prefoldin